LFLHMCSINACIRHHGIIDHATYAIGHTGLYVLFPINGLNEESYRLRVGKR
jgi:hypothetical protein